MTNATAAIALVYRTVDVQDAFANTGGVFLELKKGLNEPRAVRGVDLVVPGLSGRIQGTRLGDMLTVEVEGYVWGATGATALATFRAEQTAFRALFDPTIAGALVATLEDASTATLANARTTSVVWDEVTPSYYRVNVQLEAPGDWVVT